MPTWAKEVKHFTKENAHAIHRHVDMRETDAHAQRWIYNCHMTALTVFQPRISEGERSGLGGL